MEDTNSYKQSKLIIIVPLVISIFGSRLLDKYWHISLFFNYCLVVPVALLPTYWLVPGRKVNFTKFLGIVFGATCVCFVFLYLIPELLKLVIPRGWAYGLTVFALLQSIYWIPWYIRKQPISSITGIVWLLFSLLLAVPLGILIQRNNL